MKHLFSHTAVKTGLVLLIVFSFLSQSVYAIPFKEKYQVVTGDRSEFEEIDTPRFSELSTEYKKNGYKNAETDVQAFSVIPELSSGVAKTLDGLEGVDSTVFPWEDRCNATWKFNVQNSGLYNITFDYLLDEEGMYAVRSLEIDGNSVCTETNKVSFESLYYDDRSNGIIRNSLGDEVRPKQKNVRRWQTMSVCDSFGSFSGPLSFYFSNGEHTVTLKYVSASLYISKVTLTAPVNVLTYSSYSEKYASAEKYGKYITVEAEEMSEKSHSTIRMTSSYDPSVTPKSLTSVVNNTMGGSMWDSAGETAYWSFTVPEDGLYQLSTHILQNFNQGVPTYRRITVDGEVPFAELSAYKFQYDGDWQTVLLSDSDGNAFNIYLTAGEHVMAMTPTIGEMSTLMNEVYDCTSLLSTFMLNVIMITTSDPDLNYDYDLEHELPGITDMIDKLYNYQVSCLKELSLHAQKKSALESTFNQLLDVFTLLKDDPENTVKKLSELQTHLSSLSSTYISLQSQPLTIDSFYFGNSDKFPENSGNFFEKMYSVCANFVFSFIKDYDNITDNNSNKNYKKTISVWCGMGTEWAQVLKQLTDEYFSTETGIAIDMNILPSGQLSAGSVNALMLAICSGNAPDMALGVDAASPGEFAMRHAVTALSDFDDYEVVASQLVDNSTVSQTYENKVYGLPTQVSFKIMIYRKDIFRKYGFSLPNTWTDIYDTLLPQLYQNNMKMYIPNDIGIFMAQLDASYYNEDFSASGMDTPEAYQAFLTNTQFFTNYGCDVSASFYNRFRSGEMPIGIGSFSDYMTLQVAAPELTGKWGISLIPGTEKADGTIDRGYMSITTSSTVILADSKKKEECWQYLKWFISEDVQYDYCTLIEASIGRDSRVPTANKNALVRLAWDSDDIDVINESLSWAIETPAALGGYYTSRHLNNAWNRVVLQSKPARSSLEQAVEDINKEIKKKRKEYGLS